MSDNEKAKVRQRLSTMGVPSFQHMDMTGEQWESVQEIIGQFANGSLLICRTNDNGDLIQMKTYNKPEHSRP